MNLRNYIRNYKIKYKYFNIYLSYTKVLKIFHHTIFFITFVNTKVFFFMFLCTKVTLLYTKYNMNTTNLYKNVITLFYFFFVYENLTNIFPNIFRLYESGYMFMLFCTKPNLFCVPYILFRIYKIREL